MNSNNDDTVDFCRVVIDRVGAKATRALLEDALLTQQMKEWGWHKLGTAGGTACTAWQRPRFVGWDLTDGWIARVGDYVVTENDKWVFFDDEQAALDCACSYKERILEGTHAF